MYKYFNLGQKSCEIYEIIRKGSWELGIIKQKKDYDTNCSANKGILILLKRYDSINHRIF